MAPTESVAPAPWMRRWLIAAAAYNLLWGGLAVLAPELAFRLAGAELPRYPQLWQCIGMIVGVYGVGYAIAARNPYRHWPIVLVGLLGKVFGPVGFGWALADGSFPAAFGVTIITNDLVWWPAFAIILYRAASFHQLPAGHQPALPATQALAAALTNRGDRVVELSAGRPVLLVMLRHFGCTFCREAIADLASRRAAIEAVGTRLVLVHQASETAAAEFLAGSGLEDVPRVSDPDTGLFRALGLRRGSFSQLFGVRVWWRGFVAGVLRGHGIGRPAGDGFQLPGAFLIEGGRVVHAYHHMTAAERPDYVQLASACSLTHLEDAA